MGCSPYRRLLDAPLCHPQEGPGKARLPFALHVRTGNRAARLARLITPGGQRDMDDPQRGIKAVEAGISDRI